MPSRKSQVSKTQPSLPNVPPTEMGEIKKSTPRARTKPVGQSRGGGELFIVDNSDENWKVGNYLREWTGLSNQFDIATWYFEIGALLSMENEWQKLNKIRIMGDEVSKRSKDVLLRGIQEKLDESLEKAKDEDDFWGGVPGIVEAIRSKKSKQWYIARRNSLFENDNVIINLSEDFTDVPEDVWNFQIGGYQVCHKWLKDRRGRQLSKEDIAH